MRTLAAGWCVLVLGAAAAAQHEGRLVPLVGSEQQGSLLVAPDGKVILATGQGSTNLTLDEVLSFTTSREVRPAAAPHRVWLRSGQELPVVTLRGRAGGDGKPAAFLVELPCGVSLEVPIAVIAAVRHGGDGRPTPRTFDADRASPSANQDQLYVLKDGKTTRSAVTVVGFTGDRIDFELRGKAYDFELAGVTGIVFGTNTGVAADRQPRPRTTVTLVTGERLEGRLLALDERLRLRLDEGLIVDAPGNTLASFVVQTDRLRWLTELEPRVAQTPAFDRVWPWSRDRAPGGPGFLLGGKAYARGIGMVPRTRLTFDLGGKYDVFEAVVGIDDRGGPEAHAVLRVLVDDRLVFESPPLVRGVMPTALRIDLHHGAQLALEADFGKNFDLGDHCVFADARVVQH